MGIRSGLFNSLNFEQMQRVKAVRAAIRENRSLFEDELPPDPKKLEDEDHNPYWGSWQHLEEYMIVKLEQLVARKMEK